MPRKSEPALRNTVRKLRTESNQTQQELANQVGVTRQTIVAMESSAYVPSLPLAMRIARAFQVSVEGIFSLAE
ncbi:MAG: putative transcriptional regulator [Pirellulaceae bacterium]|jgi:putative transcriptional regulator